MVPLLVDARRAAVPVDCTLATYRECFEGEWMGQMLLEVRRARHTTVLHPQLCVTDTWPCTCLQGIVNIPYERYFVPLQVPDRGTLIDCVMMHARIFNLHVQQASRLVLLRNVEEQGVTTTHRFSEASLCKPVAEYEAAGLCFMHSGRRAL